MNETTPTSQQVGTNDEPTETVRQSGKLSHYASTIWSYIKRGWRAFRTWRRRRPFWGGVLTIVGALEMLALMWGPIQLTLIQGIAGIGTIAISVTLVAMVLISWLQPHLRSITGVLIVILGLVSMTVSNLGGFVIGMVLTVIGGALIFSWQSEKPPKRQRRKKAGPDPDDQESAKDVSVISESTKDTTGAEPEVTPETDDPDPKRENRSRAGRTVVGAAVATALAGILIITPGTPAEASPDWWPFPWPTDDESEEEEKDDDGDDEDDDASDNDPDDDDADDTEDEEEDGDDNDAECQADDLPTGEVSLGSDEAAEAAEILVECMEDEDETGPSAGDVDAPPAASDLTTLHADKMTQVGVTYEGIVDIPTETGVVSTLKFTMDSMMLENMDQSAEVPGTDQRLHVINEGSDTELHGNVELYVVSTEGLLYGLIPITITADNPIPIVPPYLVVTEMTSVTAYVSTDQVLLPDLHEPVK